MPFPGFRRYSFSQTSIQQNAPAQPGVYGISNASEWIFVGWSDDVRSALLQHLTVTGSFVLSRVPTGFTFEPCDSARCINRRDVLISELRPFCNDAGPQRSH
jgi:hypothetical protein